MITKVQKGEKNVFVYTSSTLPVLMDGSINLIYFEVDENKNNFLFENEQLSDIKLIYQLFCYPCYGNISKYIKNGVVKGEKLEDNKWQIEIDLPKKDVFHQSNPNERLIVRNIFTVK